jgi:glycosyltransferase involved in cell wall biosynthesis
MSEIRLSIIIPCHHSSATLPQCLASLSSVKDNQRLEVILIDNHADPLTRSIMKSSGWKISEEPKAGPGQARNRGAIEATGDFLMFLDSDCVVPENFFQDLLHSIEEWHADAYQVSIEPCDLNLKLRDSQAAFEWSMKNAYTLGTFNACSVDQKIPLLDSACLIVKKSVLLEMKGFPPLKRFEDRAFGIKLFEQGRLVLPLLNLKIKKIVSPRNFWRLIKNDWEEVKGQVWSEQRKLNKMTISQILSSYPFPRWPQERDLHLYLHQLIRKWFIPFFVFLHRLMPMKDESYFEGMTVDISFQVGNERFSFNTISTTVVMNSLQKITLIDKKNQNATEIVKDISMPVIRAVLTGEVLNPNERLRDFLFVGLKKRFLKKS